MFILLLIFADGYFLQICMKYPCEDMNILISKSFYLRLQVFSVVGIFYYYNRGAGERLIAGSIMGWISSDP